MTLQDSSDRSDHETAPGRSTTLSIRGIIKSVRSTRSSGCMTLRRGWLQGGCKRAGVCLLRGARCAIDACGSDATKCSGPASCGTGTRCDGDRCVPRSGRGGGRRRGRRRRNAHRQRDELRVHAGRAHHQARRHGRMGLGRRHAHRQLGHRLRGRQEDRERPALRSVHACFFAIEHSWRIFAPVGVSTEAGHDRSGDAIGPTDEQQNGSRR